MRLKSLRSHYTICVRKLNHMCQLLHCIVDVMLLKSPRKKVTDLHHMHIGTCRRPLTYKLLQTDHHKRSPVDGIRIFNPQFLLGVDEALS